MGCKCASCTQSTTLGDSVVFVCVRTCANHHLGTSSWPRVVSKLWVGLLWMDKLDLFVCVASGRLSGQALMRLNFSEFLDSCCITGLYNPNLAAGEKCPWKAFQPFLVLAVGARSRSSLRECQPLVREALAASGPLNPWEGPAFTLQPPAQTASPPHVGVPVSTENLWWELKCFHWGLLWELRLSQSWWSVNSLSSGRKVPGELSHAMVWSFYKLHVWHVYDKRHSDRDFR